MKKNNRISEFCKKNNLSTRSVILLMSIMICILISYIAGMKITTDIKKTAEQQSSTEVATMQEKVVTDLHVDLQVNINSDDISELCQLPGIGQSKANAIIDYRKENGNFTSVEELINVSGIGQKTLDNIRSYIYIK